MPEAATHVLFEEKQRADLRDYWFRYLAIVPMLLVLWKSPDLIGLLVLGSLCFPPFRTLITRLDEHGLHVRGSIAIKRTIPMEQIVRCEIVDYQVSRFWLTPSAPGLEFPSECIRVRGNRGLRLDLTDGLHLLVGSQEPERLAALIREQKAALVGA
jgi:hypothetical protein